MADPFRGGSTAQEAPAGEPLGVRSPANRAGPSSRLRRLGRRAAVVLLALAGLWLLRVPLLVGVADVLSVEDELRPADLILVLGGGIRNRPFLGAELFSRGLAPRMVLVRIEETEAERLGVFPNETDATARLLLRRGVPDSAIVVLRVPGGATSTTDEARVLRDYLARHPASSIIVVTSEYHTRRARWALRRTLRGMPVELQMAGAEDPRFTERDWWRTEAGLIAYFNEYLKFLHNWVYR